MQTLHRSELGAILRKMQQLTEPLSAEEIAGLVNQPRYKIYMATTLLEDKQYLGNAKRGLYRLAPDAMSYTEDKFWDDIKKKYGGAV